MALLKVSLMDVVMGLQMGCGMESLKVPLTEKKLMWLDTAT
jgi:hypothetical protein